MKMLTKALVSYLCTDYTLCVLQQQYMFIHDCVKDYLKEKRKEAVHIFVNQAFGENIHKMLAT